MIGSYMGMKLIESVHLTVPREDWSQVRSPGRARRRRARHPQRIRLYHVPDPHLYIDKVHNAVYAHPVTINQLSKTIDARLQL